MAEKEVDLLGEAIGLTEREIFEDSAGGEPGDLDESGDRGPEEMGDGLEGQHDADEDGADESEATDKADEAEAGDNAEQPPRAKDGKFVKADEAETKQPAKDTKESRSAEPDKAQRVPLNELLTERALRQAAEAARDADRKEFTALNARLDLALQQLETLKPKADTKADGTDEGPDIFTDPKGFISKINEGFEKRLADVQAGTSMQIAHVKHGDVFEKAYAELTKLPVDENSRRLVQGIYRSPNPGEAVVAWHRQQEASRRIGADGLDKYEERVREETRAKLMQDPDFRQQLLADLRAEASGKGRTSPPPTKLPKSLNGAAGGTQRVADPDEYDNSEASVMNYALR